MSVDNTNQGYICATCGRRPRWMQSASECPRCFRWRRLHKEPWTAEAASRAKKQEAARLAAHNKATRTSPDHKSCQICGQPIGRHGARGRCARCYAYWKGTGKERPGGTQKEHPRQFTYQQLYDWYWKDGLSSVDIAERTDPPVDAKVVRRWMHLYNIPRRRTSETARINGKKHSAGTCQIMRDRMAAHRAAGRQPTEREILRNEQSRLRLAAYNRSRAKRRQSGLLAVLSEAHARERERQLKRLSGISRLRKLDKL